MSVRISQLNKLNQITSDDFVPIVDSGSLTTFYTPISVVGSWFSDSGSVLSASWASRSINAYGTASYATNIRRWESYERNLTNTVGNAIPIFYVTSTHHLQTFLISLQVFGLHCSCAKTYIISSNIKSPGFKPPFGDGTGTIQYSGWFTAQPISTPGIYPTNENPYTDYDLELSESFGTQLSFRVRTSIDTTIPVGSLATPTASISVISLSGYDAFFYNDNSSEIASSNTLPSWGSAFVTQEGNYKFKISGSVIAEKGFTGSLAGTSSWAISCSYAQSASNVNTASYVLQAVSASFATTASYTLGTASYALTIPNVGLSSVPGIVPVGTILDFAGTSCPNSDWLICTGSNVNRTMYATLFAVIGETWGVGDTTTTFGLPNLSRRMTLGISSSKSNNSFISTSVGNVGGGEALNYHHHMLGYSQTGYSNDDFFVSNIGTTRLSSSNFVPRTNGPGNINPFWRLNGDASTFVAEYGGSGNIIYGGSGTLAWIGTSFGIADPLNWISDDSTWNTPTDMQTLRQISARQDLNMPYAVTMKIIRAR